MGKRELKYFLAPFFCYFCFVNHINNDVKKTIIYILLLLSSISHLNAQGLYFHSYEVNKDLRTTLNLTADKSISLINGFTLEFDLKLRREKHNFGYIFRMIVGDKQSMDLVVQATSSSRTYFLVTENENKLTFSSKNSVQDDTLWTHVRITYAKENDELSLLIGDVEQKVKLGEVKPNFENVKIFFGETGHQLFSTTDVAPMTLRNIQLTQTGGKSYFWELCKHGQNEVMDENHNLRAVVRHPVWLIDQKAYWKKCMTFQSAQRNFWAFNEEKSEIYLAGPSHLYLFSLKNNQFCDTITYTTTSCFYSNAAQLVYDSRSNRLLSYEIDSTEVECFNFNTRQWKNKHTTPSAANYWHHNHYISPDSSIYCFGGYGYHRYKSILKSYSFKTGQWQQQDLSANIAPRYLAGLGQGDKKIYIFGGYGSKTGEQQVSPRYFYDLYELNPQNKFVRKVWEYENPGESFVQGNSMVINEKEKCFYTLCYSSEKYHSCIYLNRFSLEHPTRTILGDSIPFLFNDTESMCDLFLDKNDNKLIALVQTLNKNNLYEIEIYSLAYPPIIYTDAFQRQTSGLNILIVYAGIFFFIIATVGAYLFYKKRKRKTNLPNNTPDTSVASSMGYSCSEESQETSKVAKKPSSITLLGGFQVIGSNGEDMTGSFTPTLKNLLVFILLSTITKNKGISSEILIEQFWYDKNESSARNNLSVNIKRLRLLLEQVGSIQVIHSNGYWTIELAHSVTCDYQEVRKLIDLIHQSPKAISEDKIVLLIEHLKSGALLPSIQSEWMDGYKSEYTNKAIDTLRKILEIERFTTPSELKLKVCNAIVALDPLDEDALVDKCRILYALGRKGQAKNTYDIYCKNYLALLNSEFKIPFSVITQEK